MIYLIIILATYLVGFFLSYVFIADPGVTLKSIAAYFFFWWFICGGLFALWIIGLVPYNYPNYPEDPYE